MKYLLWSCGVTCCLTYGILCHILPYHDIQCYLMIFCSSPAFLSYCVLSHVGLCNCLICLISLIKVYERKLISGKSFLEQKSPWTNVSLDNCPLDNSLFGKRSPWTNFSLTNVSTLVGYYSTWHIRNIIFIIIRIIIQYWDCKLVLTSIQQQQ